MATTAEIREGLAANCRQALPTTAGQVSAYVKGAPKPPCIQIFPEAHTYHEAMQNGAVGKRYVVQALVGFSDDIAAQKRLDALLDDDSVKAAIESDCTLGGKVDDLIVREASGYKVFQFEGARTVLGCDWTVEIID